MKGPCAARIDTVLHAIAARNSVVNAYTHVLAERARAEAGALDARGAENPPGPLAGMPYAVKNLFDVAGLPTLAGSKINAGAPPAAVDAVLVQRLRAAGAVLTGTLNMDEYAYGFTTENDHYGPTRNPHDVARSAGGSSGGSGAAVAAGLVPFTLGSDTNGSIRVPASLCGVYGLKPTYGRLPRSGTFPFVSSLDHLGPLADCVTTLAAAYDAMQGPDEADPACAGRPPEPVSPDLDHGIDGLRIAVAGGYFSPETDSQADRAVAQIGGALGVQREILLPEAERARAAAYVITAAEGAQLHLQLLRTRLADFDQLIRPRLLAGSQVPAVWYVRAQRLRRWFHERVMALFREVDVFIAPATPVSARPLGREHFLWHGKTLPLRPNLGMYTQPLSLVGLPVVVVPVDTGDGLPIGVQIVAPPWRENWCMRVARHLEKAAACRAWITDTQGHV